MDYELIIRTDADGNPRIESQSGPLPANATMKITGSEEETAEPWVRFIVINDVVVDTGAVAGIRVPQSAGAR